MAWLDPLSFVAGALVGVAVMWVLFVLAEVARERAERGGGWRE